MSSRLEEPKTHNGPTYAAPATADPYAADGYYVDEYFRPIAGRLREQSLGPRREPVRYRRWVKK